MDDIQLQAYSSQHDAVLPVDVVGVRQAGAELHDGGTVCGKRFSERRADLIHAADGHSEGAERLGHRCEVRVFEIDHRGAAEPAHLLRLQDAVPAVVDDQRDDVDAELDGRRELGGREQEPAVAADGKDPAVGPRHGGPDGHGEFPRRAWPAPHG